MSKYRFDSLMSAMTRIGTALDPRKSYVFTKREHLTPQEADDLFSGNDLAYRVCCILPEEALSECWTLESPDEEDETRDQVAARLTELGAQAAIVDAAVFGRVFGDTFLYVDVEDGTKNELPLDLTKVRKVNFLKKIERDRISGLTKYTDVKSPKYDEYETYQISNALGVTAVIHETRLIRFTGARTSDMDRRANNMWHRSVLDKIYEVLRDFGITWSSAALLVNQGTQGIYKFKDLSMLLAAPGTEGREALSTRVGMIDMVRSALRSIILDADVEDFSYEVAPLTSLPEVLDRFGSRLAAAADGIPVTKLFGISPAGMNATGEADAKNWYRILDSYRTTTLQPPVERLVDLVLAELKKPDAEITVSWQPLDQPSDTEEAQRRAAIVASDVALVNAGVLYPDEVAKARFGRAEGFDLEIRIDPIERARLEAEAEEKAAEQAQAMAESDEDDTDPGAAEDDAPTAE